MKKLLLLLCLIAVFQPAICQVDMFQRERSHIDSIIHLISQTNDENKKVDLLFEIYVSIDAYPALFFEVYRKLFELSQNGKDIILESSAWSATGQGTGLGLSLSYDIIKAHGGEIKVESKEGEGTEFTILLPCS